MAGNATFESASASSCKLGFSESYLNGQRGVRSAAVAAVVPNVDKLGNLKEGFESRVFRLGFDVAHGGTGSSALVASDGSRPLSQCILLEPIEIPEQITWCDELKRVLGTEDNSLRVASAHVKPVIPMAVVKDLKRCRLSARVRANKMDACLRKLDKYCEGISSKKQKMIYSINQRVEDRPKNILLNKRVRTSVAESRAKDGNLLENNDGESDLYEMIRRLAAGGKGWDKKIKRKRSGGTFISRPVDSDEVPKRTLQKKVADEHFRLSNCDDSLGNRKRPMPPSGSPSPPISQWIGQRPQKMARVRKPNLVPHVSNQVENRLSFESHSPSDVSARLTSKKTNGSPISKNATNSPQKFMVKLENFQSPLLSENQESAGGQSRLMGKEFGNNEVVAIPKNKPLFNAVTPIPLQNSKTGHNKNGSKPVRRLQKLLDRKGFSRHSPFQNNRSPDCNGASDDDRGELLAAANYARVAPNLACSSPLWKKMEPVFASVSSEDKSFLIQEAGQLHENSVSNMQNQENRSFSEKHDMDKTSKGSIPLFQRVLSALIIEDNIDTFEEGDTTDTYNHNNIGEDLNSEVNLFTRISKDFLNGPHRYEEMCVDDDTLLQELHSIGIYPDIMPHLHDEENGPIQHEIDKLKTQLHQQEVKKKAYLENLCKQVERDTGSRDLETDAMDRMVELSCRKLQANRRNPRSGKHKLPSQAALAFANRTLVRCHKFENSGVSCFSEPPFQDILFAPVENDTKLLSDDFAINGPSPNKGKKKEILLNDIGTTKSRKPGPKPKPRPRQKAVQPTTPGNESTRSTHPTGPTWPTAYRRDVRALSQDRKGVNDPIDLNELDPLDELGAGGPQDLNSFLNFDEQDPELDFAGGLDIPMDDLTELF